MENSVQVVDDTVVPNADHAIAVGAKCAIAVPVLGTFRVLAAVELDKQAPIGRKVSGVPARPSPRPSPRKRGEGGDR